jgi:uncharacterized membrane-anchored protein
MNECSLCKGRKVVRSRENLDPNGNALGVIEMILEWWLLIIAVLAAISGSLFIGVKSFFSLSAWLPRTWTGVVSLLVLLYIVGVSLYTLYRTVWPRWIRCPQCGGRGT